MSDICIACGYEIQPFMGLGRLLLHNSQSCVLKALGAAHEREGQLRFLLDEVKATFDYDSDISQLFLHDGGAFRRTKDEVERECHGAKPMRRLYKAEPSLSPPCDIDA